MITITEHNKTEWSRMAQAAYASGRNEIGHRYSAAASLPANTLITCAEYDALQEPYREWLISGFKPLTKQTYTTKAAHEMLIEEGDHGLPETFESYEDGNDRIECTAEEREAFEEDTGIDITSDMPGPDTFRLLRDHIRRFDDFLSGFMDGSGLAHPVEASEQWAGFSRQLSDLDRWTVESSGYDGGKEQGKEFAKLYTPSI